MLQSPKQVKNFLRIFLIHNIIVDAVSKKTNAQRQINQYACVYLMLETMYNRVQQIF